MEVKTELQKNAILEERKKELDVYQRALDIQWLNSRMEDGRMGRCMALINREAEMEKEYQERTDHAAIVNARAEKEIALGKEVAKVRREEACELLRRHYLRERDPSLRQLITKLSAGYTCRDLRQQILNNEYKRLQDKAEHRHANAILSKALFNNKEAQEYQDKIKIEKNRKYTKELQMQLVNRQMQKQCIYEDTLVEKKMLEEVMRTLADEDQRELQQKRMLKERTRREMVVFQQAKEAWKAKQTQMVIHEERDIAEQKKALADRSSAIIEARMKKLEAREALNQRIAAKVLAEQAERLERENIIKSLQEQERLEQNAKDDIYEKQKMERDKRNTLEALTNQMEFRKQEERDRREVELRIRKETEAKIAADEEKEREKLRMHKEKGRTYALQLKQQIQDNAERRRRELAGEQARARSVFDTDRAWQAEVAEERKKIIGRHAPPLMGYLQAGVITPVDVSSARGGALDALAQSTSNAGRRTRPKCNPQCMLIRDY